MTGSFALMKQRRFLPLFATQFLNAFNDNFYKMAMVILVTFTIYKDPETEAWFNALAGGLFILPFFLFSALAGQLADSTDKTRMIRLIKSAEIGIMIVGASGIWLHNVPLMLLALFSMGMHSTFFGPIKYAILPQHLEEDEVLAGTGWVEAGTYIAILGGTIVGGLTPPHIAIPGIVVVAVIGRLTASFVPAAPPEKEAEGLAIDHNVLRSSWQIVNGTMHIPRLFLAIVSISFFWAIGAILAAQFPPLVKNALGGDNTAWLARGRPADGCLATLELEPRHAAIARKNLDRLSFPCQIEIKVGDAIQSLKELHESQVAPFDLIFIDADKSQYPDYLEWSIKLSRKGTMIIADNVVRKGAIIDERSEDLSVRGVRRFNAMVSQDPRLQATAIQTVGAKGYDGFCLIYVDA